LSELTRDDVRDLERRATAGDAHAFGALLRRWDRDLRGVAWSVVGGGHLDDVMQEAYERAFRKIGDFDGRSSLKTWLHTIVHRTAIDVGRYEARRRHHDLDDPAVHAAVDDAVDVHADLASRGALGRLEIAAMLARLPVEQRMALMLTVGLGHSYDEAAAITGESRGTIASRVNRARARLERWEQD
jgi:RNA polymerase sigma-70 factor (ECF subfamily)